MSGFGRVLLFKGKGWMSRAIRWQTRSQYSHAALLYPDGKTLLESWQGVGVRRKLVTRWDCIDTFIVNGMTEEQWAYIFQEGEKLIGKKYDYWAILRFVSRRRMPKNDRWFCSELVLHLCKKAGLPLLRGLPSEESPGDVGLSPYLQLETKIA